MALSKKLLNPGEEIVVSVRTHPKALLLPILVLVVLLALEVAYLVYGPENGIGRIVVGVVLALAAVRWVLAPFLVWLTASYTFTDRRMITRNGVITRRGHDIPLSRISDVAYEFGLIDRMLGCGTLLVSDASTHGTVTLPDIPRVEETQRKVNELLHGLHDRETRAHEGH